MMLTVYGLLATKYPFGYTAGAGVACEMTVSKPRVTAHLQLNYNNQISLRDKNKCTRVAGVRAHFMQVFCGCAQHLQRRGSSGYSTPTTAAKKSQ